MPISAKNVYEAFQQAELMLENKLDLINGINVFPVPDGDTGTNMQLSIKSVNEKLTKICSDKDHGASDVFRYASEILLSEAKGNSGTILTLFFQGLSDSLREQPGNTDTVDVGQLAKALYDGGEHCYHGIQDPRPGTIITVARQIGQTALSYAESASNCADLIKRVSDEAYSMLPLTTYQNPTLEKYHVVDSGAFGFCLILDGFVCALLGQNDFQRSYDFIGKPSELVGPKDLTYPYCTEFVIARPSDKSVEIIKKQLADIGDCLIPAVDETFLKVHIHTANPEAVFFIASLSSPIIRKKVDNMLLSSQIKKSQADVFLCKDDLTSDGIKSMDYKYVYNQNEKEAFDKTITSLLDDSCSITLYTSENLASKATENIPKIRYFNTDDDLLAYMFAKES